MWRERGLKIVLVLVGLIFITVRGFQQVWPLSDDRNTRLCCNKARTAPQTQNAEDQLA